MMYLNVARLKDISREICKLREKNLTNSSVIFRVFSDEVMLL